MQADAEWQRPVAEVSNKALTRLAERLARWQLVPTGTEGYRKAEVTLGGVDTRELSSRTMESRQPGLYFIGEVDATGFTIKGREYAGDGQADTGFHFMVARPK